MLRWLSEEFRSLHVLLLGLPFHDDKAFGQ